MENTTIFYKAYKTEEEAMKAIADNGYTLKACGSDRRYQRANEYAIVPYSGRHGEGCKMYVPSKNGFTTQYGRVRHSNQYCQVLYFVKEGGAR